MTPPMRANLVARARKLAEDRTLFRRLYRQHYYRPYGTMAEIWDDTSPEIVLSGAAGTGKSRYCLELMYRYAMEYPGMRGLIVRKVRADLNEAGLETFESKVLGAGHPLTERARNRRQRYVFPNRSVIVVGGLDQGLSRQQGSKVMSTEYDIIFVQEAIQLTETDWDNLTTRLRNGVMPFQQLLADTNPSAPSHFLLQRARAGHLKMVHTRHTDNPVLYDHGREDWTDQGRAYLARLEKLTGARKSRLLAGLWVQEEGIVYDNWSEANKTTEEPDPFLPTGLAFDDGYYPDPRVILFIQEKPNGDILIFDEMVHTRHLAETCVNETVDRFGVGWPLNDQALEDLEAMGRMDETEWRGDQMYLVDGWRLPEIAIGSTEAKELRERFRRANIVARGGTHRPITAGIDRMRRYICDDRGRRRLLVHRRCTNLISEIEEGYKYPQGGKAGDIPVDESNHGVDGLRYYLWLRGEK